MADEKIILEEITDADKWDEDEFVDVNALQLQQILNQETSKDPDRVLLVNKNEQTNQLLDPFQEFYQTEIGKANIKLIEPPFNLKSLRKVVAKNNAVKQCVDISVRSIEGTGGKLVYIGEDGDKELPEAAEEFLKFTHLIKFANAKESLMALRKKVRIELETYGFACIEVCRNANNDINSLYHVPSETMRLSNLSQEQEEIETKIVYKKTTRTETRFARFRVFCQMVNNTKVYFKEFGSKKDIDKETGNYAENLDKSRKATEIIYLSLHNAGEVYGLPRWINQLPSVFGSREAELLNLSFFEENAIPAMALILSNMQLTKDSKEAIADYVTSKKGKKSLQRFLVLSGKPHAESSARDGTPGQLGIKFEPLQDKRQSEEQFKGYDTTCRHNVQSAFQYPDIIFGRSSDYTRAAVREALTMVEEHVFKPEREMIDDIINNKLFVNAEGEPAKYWKFESNPLVIPNPDQLPAVTKTLNEQGAITPNVAIQLANKQLHLDIPLIDKPWGDYPFQIIKDLIASGKDLSNLDSLFDGAAQEEQPLNV